MQVFHGNIPDDVMRNAHEIYQIVRTDFTQNRKLITRSNFLKILYQFCTRQLKPLTQILSVFCTG